MMDEAQQSLPLQLQRTGQDPEREAEGHQSSQGRCPGAGREPGGSQVPGSAAGRHQV